MDSHHSDFPLLQNNIKFRYSKTTPPRLLGRCKSNYNKVYVTKVIVDMISASNWSWNYILVEAKLL